MTFFHLRNRKYFEEYAVKVHAVKVHGVQMDKLTRNFPYGNEAFGVVAYLVCFDCREQGPLNSPSESTCSIGLYFFKYQELSGC